MKLVLKLLLSLLLSAVLFSPTQNVNASRKGDIGYWDTNVNYIGRWNSTPMTIQFNWGNNGFSDSEFLSYVNHARNQWRNAGITIGSTTTESNASLKIYGGTYDALWWEAPGLTTDHYGLAIILQQNYEGYWAYIGNRYNSNNITRADAFVVHRNNRSANQYRSTATHELGHALGWYGHTRTSGNVMSSAPSSRTHLTSIDRRHIRQIYYR